jgi:hypothetical protein
MLAAWRQRKQGERVHQICSGAKKKKLCVQEQEYFFVANLNA